MARKSRDPGREFVPPVAKIRLQYAKRGRLRFSSHRDFQRALERALRRAQIPMAYSAGFRPHPKISYSNAAPTGAASEAEYVEIGIADRIPPSEIMVRLNDALPAGLDIVEAVEATDSDFAARLQASVWQFEFGDVAAATVEAARQKLLAQPTVTVERMTKSGVRVIDVRAAITSAEVRLSPELPHTCAILTVVVTHGTPSVRPDDVLAALRKVADLVPPVPVRVTRLAQGLLTADVRGVSDPLAHDREVAAQRTQPA